MGFEGKRVEKKTVCKPCSLPGIVYEKRIRPDGSKKKERGVVWKESG